MATSPALQGSVEHMRNARNADIERIVSETVQRYLGASATLPLSIRLLEDLGVDSLGLVSILMELSDELHLDLMAVEISLKKIDTLADLVSLVTYLVVASNSSEKRESAF